MNNCVFRLISILDDVFVLKYKYIQKEINSKRNICVFLFIYDKTKVRQKGKYGWNDCDIFNVVMESNYYI